MSKIDKLVTGNRKRATNISLDIELVEAARALDINVSQACERGLAAEVAAARKAAWLAQNRAALEDSNRFVAQRGLPLAKQRLF